MDNKIIFEQSNFITELLNADFFNDGKFNYELLKKEYQNINEYDLNILDKHKTLQDYFIEFLYMQEEENRIYKEKQALENLINVNEFKKLERKNKI